MQEIKMKKILPGAGVVVVRKFDNEIKFLALKQFNTGNDKFSMGLFDIPKGIKEDDESFFRCAIRECFEEANINLTEGDFIWGDQFIKLSKLIVFLAITENDFKIKQNPVTGIQEHESGAWLSAEEIKTNILPWLVPAIDWAVSIVENNRKCTSTFQRYN